MHRILPSGDDRSVREKILGLEVRASPPAAERGGSAGLVLLLEAGESENWLTENGMSQARALNDDARVIEQGVPGMRRAVLVARASLVDRDSALRGSMSFSDLAGVQASSGESGTSGRLA